MISKCKKNYKLVIGFVLGILVSGGIVYAATIGSNQVSYDNSKSGMSATTMQQALDELYEKSDIRKYGNFVSAYTYNQTEGSSNYCITGEESTCKKSSCYKTKTANSCKAGDIIKYKVNDTDIITFHVMYDNGETLTMQSQKNTIYYIPWSSLDDYVESGGKEEDYINTEFGRPGINNRGPVTAIKYLEKVTEGWDHVEDQIYTMGKTIFAEDNAHTGCDYYLNCTDDTYTWKEKTAKARMITVQETTDLGCSTVTNTCPKWLYRAKHVNKGYWTMNAMTNFSITARVIGSEDFANSNGLKDFYNEVSNTANIKAVVVVKK